MNRTNSLSLQATIHTKSLLIPVGMNVCLRTFPFNTNQITQCHLELIYQYILSN